MTLVEYDETVEILAAPLQQLFQSRLVLAAGRVALAYQRRIRAEDDALLHVVVDGRRDFSVLELVEGVHVDLAGTNVAQIAFGVVL